MKEKGERVLAILIPDGKFLGNPTRIIEGNLQINLKKGAKGEKHSLGVIASLTLDPVYQGDKNNAANRLLMLKYSSSLDPILVSAVSTFLNPAGAASAAAAAAAAAAAVAPAARAAAAPRRHAPRAAAGRNKNRAKKNNAPSKNVKSPRRGLDSPALPTLPASASSRLFYKI